MSEPTTPTPPPQSEARDPTPTRAPRPMQADLAGRIWPVLVQLGIIAVVWYLGFLPHVVAIGLGVISVVAGLVPERWSALTAGILLLIGAALIYVNYDGSGDRKLALLAAILGVAFAVYGAVRLRAER